MVGAPEAAAARAVIELQKGAIRLEVRFHGRIAHGAMPTKGINPIAAIGSILAFAQETEQAIQQGYGGDPQLGAISITPTVLTAGSRVQLNLTPPTATADFDIRTTPALGHCALIEAFDRQVQSIAASLGARGEIEVIDDRPLTSIDAETPPVRAVVGAHTEVYGTKPAYGGVPGTTYATILMRDAHLPVVLYRPGGNWIAH